MSSPLTREQVLVTGSSGLIGSALCTALARQGADAVRFDRRSPPRDYEGFSAIVNLAGESIAGGPWTKEKRRRIRESRVRLTSSLADAVARARRPPRAFISASAIGWYGDRGDTPVDETAAPGSGFLADVCRDWEAAALPAREAGIRTVWARFGIVVSRRGGALSAMLPAFRLGLGGRLGSGRQWMSWIALDDAIGALLHAIRVDAIAGPMNIASPAAVTNLEWTRTLGRVLDRPTFASVPAFVLRALLGDMAKEMLLAGARVVPRRLEETGFAFSSRELESTLRHELERAESS
jgi:uncharacterized protein (TIGR01777 family)